MRRSILNLQSEGYSLKNMGPRLSLSRHTQTVADQSHGLSMTPVSIEQLRTPLRQESNKKQKQSETKLDGSLKYDGAN